MQISRTTKNRITRAAKATPPAEPRRHERAAPVTSSAQADARKAVSQPASGKRIKRRELSPADSETRRTQLKNLIALGKERRYLTHAEINDHLPDMLDAEQLESIIGMINDMGIEVCDEAPDAETLLTPPATAAVPDEAAAEAEAALATMDTQFDRTPDPVRMYLREMGSVELLTRAREIEIAKRIEDALQSMIQAIYACPTTVNEILVLAEKIEKDEVSIDEVVDGLAGLDLPEGPDHGKKVEGGEHQEWAATGSDDEAQRDSDRAERRHDQAQGGSPATLQDDPHAPQADATRPCGTRAAQPRLS